MLLSILEKLDLFSAVKTAFYLNIKIGTVVRFRGEIFTPLLYLRQSILSTCACKLLRSSGKHENNSNSKAHFQPIYFRSQK